MPCEGFRGVMSCRCVEECWESMEKHTRRGRFISVSDKICFTTRDGHAPHLSDAPANLSDLIFFARARLKMPDGWVRDDSVPRRGHDLDGRSWPTSASRRSVRSARYRGPTLTARNPAATLVRASRRPTMARARDACATKGSWVRRARIPTPPSASTDAASTERASTVSADASAAGLDWTARYRTTRRLAAGFASPSMPQPTSTRCPQSSPWSLSTSATRARGA
eukprot:6606507-Prymnesium_polylepis.1